MEQGTFYGIGVGPGDPELLTLKAARIIGQSAVVAYPVNGSGESLARTIAADVIDAGCPRTADPHPHVHRPSAGRRGL